MTANPGEHVALEFSVFETESYDDRLYIFDGNLPTSDLLVLWLSGNVNRILEAPWKSTGEHLLLVFESDASSTYKGYQASFTSVECKYTTVYKYYILLP